MGRGQIMAQECQGNGPQVCWDAAIQMRAKGQECSKTGQGMVQKWMKALDHAGCDDGGVSNRPGKCKQSRSKNGPEMDEGPEGCESSRPCRLQRRGSEQKTRIGPGECERLGSPLLTRCSDRLVLEAIERCTESAKKHAVLCTPQGSFVPVKDMVGCSKEGVSSCHTVTHRHCQPPSSKVEPTPFIKSRAFFHLQKQSSNCSTLPA